MTDAVPIAGLKASQLRGGLERSARMLAPGWAGATQDGDFGRALLEIAARLAEHSTTQLAKAPLRDKLAFLDALDVATPPPRPASAPIVFTLAEKRETAVFAPARVQLSADKGKDQITFETREGIDLSPARLAHVIAADPVTDRIERAPAFVNRSVDAVAPPTRYLLLTAVEAEAKTIQLVQAVAIEPGDLLRFAGGVYRVESVKGAIVQLRDPLGQSAPAGAAVEKLIALESFALRNLQDHAVYFGHKEMLKLDGPAEITLVFDPQSLPAALASLDLDYAIWGKPKEAKAPDWQPLNLVAAGPAGLVLAKTWEGSVDEFELPAGKSRWVRIALRAPIAGQCGPATGAVSVELKVRSTAPAKSAGEGSETVVAALYNSQPLSIATAFLPFGPEPQRFDTFAFAAPEALSKKGAKVTLDIKFDDASLAALAYDPVAPEHVYGISINGRLQSIRFDGASADWRPLGLSDGKRLEAKAGLHVLSLGTLDLVFVRGEDGALRMATVTTAPDGKNWTLTAWTDLSKNRAAFSAFLVVPDPARMAGSTSGASPGQLIAADGDGFWSLAIGLGGVLAQGWQQLVAINDADKTPTDVTAVVVARTGIQDGVLAAVGADGRGHKGELDLANGTIEWSVIGSGVSGDVRPAAFMEDGELVFVAASAAEKPEDRSLIVIGSSDPPSNLNAPLGAPYSIALLPRDDGAPLVAVTGSKGILLWAGGHSKIDALPAKADPAALRALLTPSGNEPRLLLAADSEMVLESKVATALAGVSVELRDRLRRSQSSTVPTHMWLKDQGSSPAIHVLEADWILAGNNLIRPAPLTSSQHYILLDSAVDFGGSIGSTGKLELDPLDNQTAVGDVLEIGGAAYEVAQLDSSTNTVDLDPALPSSFGSPGDALGYTAYRHGSAKTAFVQADRKRFAKPANLPIGDLHEIIFDSSAAPRHQEIAGTLGVWMLLRKPWTTTPADPVTATLLTRSGLGTPHEIRLPREADNPELAWEYFDGTSWSRLDRWKLTDSTGNFARTGDVSFNVPSDIVPAEIGGKNDYWIRVRLTGGDFGRASYVITNDPATGDPKTTSITIDRSKLNPPEIVSIEASYVLNDAITPDLIVAANNLAAIDQTQAALRNGAVFNLFEGVAQHVGDSGGGSRALYLGFDRNPGVQALSLFVDALDRDAPRRELVAEVLTAAGWQRAGLDDETAGLARPGIFQLRLAPKPEQLPLFGSDGWWLRLRPKDTGGDWAPVLRGLFVNAVLADHAKSVTKELLGSSLGDPNQSYRLAQTPVLPQTLELRVLESLSEEERAALILHHGREAIVEDQAQRGQWVRWSETESFVDADGDTRVFRLDSASGEVRFGNGRSGKVPPAGRDSIRAFTYQCGGGSAGNVRALEIAKLDSAIESVELALNPVDASGGADAPAIERIAVSAPALLRHAGRALSPVDIEAIAEGSAPDVVRARCLPPRGCGIELAVSIRDPARRCPVPSRERREGIARNILAAGWGALAPDAVTVRAPRYLRVRIEAELIASGAEAAAGVEHEARTRLMAFLHPADGGSDKLGWAFGRRVWPSDVHRALAGTPGLDRVAAVRLDALSPGVSLDELPLDALICVEDADIALTVSVGDGGR